MIGWRGDTLDMVLATLPGLPWLSDADCADPGTAMQRRTDEERHMCRLCGERRARFVVTIGPSAVVGPARWLDLCGGHVSAVHKLMDNWPGDQAVLERWHELKFLSIIP